MPATSSTTETTGAIPYLVSYYPARLTSFDLEHAIPQWAAFCRRGSDGSTLLAAYLAAVVSFEKQRREAIDSGHEVLEVFMPEVPCHAWSGIELAKALQKSIGMACRSDGEVREMARHILNSVLVETQLRLGYTG